MDCWNMLPLVPLRNILEYLELKDAMAATATCRYWRAAVCTLEYPIDTLRLKATEVQKSLFLTLIHKKYTERLHIYIDCGGEELDYFMQMVLPHYLEGCEILTEIAFISRKYTDKNGNTTNVFKLKSPITDSLINANKDGLRTVAFLGCEPPMEGFVYWELDDISDLPSLSYLEPPFEHQYSFNALYHVCMDYESMNVDLMNNLLVVPTLSLVTINLFNKENVKTYQPLPWEFWRERMHKKRVRLAVNIVGLPKGKFDEVMKNVFKPRMPASTIRVMFCSFIHYAFIRYVARNYKDTLREFHWIDSQVGSKNDVDSNTVYCNDFDTCIMHPLILLCWKCEKLQKLTIHGYWLWQYDVLGMARLRYGSLRQLHMSAIYDREARYPDLVHGDNVKPVRGGDTQAAMTVNFVQEMNDILSFRWSPILWHNLDPALRACSTDDDKTRYIATAMLKSFGLP